MTDRVVLCVCIGGGDLGIGRGGGTEPSDIGIDIMVLLVL
jgi:hypothetical protein